MNNFSVIVPIYYGENYIPGIIRQMELCREYMKKEDSIEIVFVNDAPFAPINYKWNSKSIDITIINSNKNVGIHSTRLKGLLQCKGEFVLFLDQDDQIQPEYFESQVEKLEDNDAVVCKAIHENRFKYSKYLPFERAVSKNYMLTQGNGIVSPGQVLLRKKSISPIWIRNTLVHNGSDDWLLWICMMSENRKFALNDAILYEHVMEGENTSENFLEMTYSEHEMVQILESEEVLNRDELKILSGTVKRLCQERIHMIDKYEKRYFMYRTWLQVFCNSFSISDYLKTQGCKSIAIYGDGYFGKQLYKELKKNYMKVICFIDRNADNLNEEIPIYKPEENFPKIDIIIITIIQDSKNVARLLQQRSSAKVLCLIELLEEILFNNSSV